MFSLQLPSQLTLTRDVTDMFAFDLYDRDGGRPLTPAEVLTILEDMFGKAEFKTDVHAKRYDLFFHILIVPTFTTTCNFVQRQCRP